MLFTESYLTYIWMEIVTSATNRDNIVANERITLNGDRGSQKVTLCRSWEWEREREEREKGWKHSGFNGRKVLREFRIEGLDHGVDDKHE